MGQQQSSSSDTFESLLDETAGRGPTLARQSSLRRSKHGHNEPSRQKREGHVVVEAEQPPPRRREGMLRQGSRRLTRRGGKRDSFRKQGRQDSSKSLGDVSVSSSASAASNNSAMTLPPPMEPGCKEFYLKKRRQSLKKGLHWEEDPTGETWLHHTRHWPRECATLRGKEIKVKGRKWLLATHVKQVDSEKWHRAPKGAAVPFFYSNLFVLVPTKPYERKERKPVMPVILSIVSVDETEDPTRTHIDEGSDMSSDQGDDSKQDVGL